LASTATLAARVQVTLCRPDGVLGGESGVHFPGGAADRQVSWAGSVEDPVARGQGICPGCSVLLTRTSEASYVAVGNAGVRECVQRCRPRPPWH
jgi:hypothetical protein